MSPSRLLTLFPILVCPLLLYAAARAGEPDTEGWYDLFDGKTLGKWKIAEKYDFKHHGKC